MLTTNARRSFFWRRPLKGFIPIPLALGCIAVVIALAWRRHGGQGASCGTVASPVANGGVCDRSRTVDELIVLALVGAVVALASIALCQGRQRSGGARFAERF